MNSNTGFENTASKERENTPHKKTVSKGLMIVAIFLVVIIIAWVLLEMMNKSLMKDVSDLQAQIMQTNESIALAMSKEDSDFAARAYMLEKDLYRQYEANDVLGEIERIMIVKNSDQSGARVVLKTFQYDSGANVEKNFNDGNATITGAGSVTISADADTFDVMAQQIDVFKKSDYFSNVKVGSTDRDDSGRIIFTLTMDVANYDKSPYESDMQKEENMEVSNDTETTDEVIITDNEETLNEAPTNTVVGEGVEINTQNITNTVEVETNTVTDTQN